MKKIITTLVLVLLAFIFVGCGTKEVAVESISVVSDKQELYIGETANLTATVLPATATDKKVTYSANPESVATVDSSTGKVTAVSEGTVTITAKAGSKESTVTLVIKVAVSEVKISIENPEVLVGGTTKVNVEVLPNNASDKSYSLSSLNEAVATVATDGTVTAVAPGVTKIKVTSGGKTAEVEVTVNPIEVSEVKLTAEKTELKVDETTNLTIEVLPEDATNKSYTLVSSNENVVKVTEEGLVTAVGVGEATITLTAGTKSATVVITVKENVITVEELQGVLVDLLNQYKNSLNGEVKLTVQKGDANLVTEFAYNYSEEGINELKYKQNSTSESHVYVKDGKVYMLRDALKNYTLLTPSEVTLLKNTYGFDAVTKEVTKFYSEAKFFESLAFESLNDGVITYALDLVNYSGTVLNTAGKDSIKLVVKLVDDAITKVDLLIQYSDDTTGSTSLEFLGTSAPTIQFPGDLFLYQAA